MPWTPRDAYRHTRKASTPDLQTRWAATANAVLERTGDEAQAIRIANDAISKRKPRRKRPSTTKAT